jgi:HlyD family secretion protein
MPSYASPAEELHAELAKVEGGRKWLKRLAFVLALAGVTAGTVVWREKHRPATPSRFVTSSVTKGDVVEKVQATGTVQPLLQVNVGAQVNGRVVSVHVDFNSPVKKGDLLAEIDPSVYGAQASQQEANLAAQRAQIESANGAHEAAKANYDRMQRLVAQKLASKAELDAAKGQYDTTKASIEAARAALKAIEAQLKQSLTNVGYTRIVAPIDGVVVNRAIDPGATVAASFQTPTLFVVAQDLKRMRVIADVDEADVGKLAEGMAVEAVVDAFPGETFKGTLSQLRFSANTVQGVVTYPAIVEVENPDEKLRPGMTATIAVRTRQANGVRRVPNAAMRFKPSPAEGSGEKKGREGAGSAKPAVAAREAGLPKGEAQVYVLKKTPGPSGRASDVKEEPVATRIHVGITDGLHTELVDDAELAGDVLVITDETDEKKDKKKPF